jgi:hypothetical protein
MGQPEEDAVAVECMSSPDGWEQVMVRRSGQWSPPESFGDWPAD